MPLIVLWDIDHTLIDNAGVSKEIYAAAFAAMVGTSPTIAASTEGRTDRLIMREMFVRHDLPVPEWSLIEAALTEAGQDRKDELARRGTTLPGVRAALKAASVQSGWVSSVLTGNIASNARMKLSVFGLDAMLDMHVGAYGSDAERRHDLVAVARRRVRRKHGVPSDVPLVLVGDTPLDIEAALLTGSAVIAVATGIHCSCELAAAGAPVVLSDLSDTDGLLALLAASAHQTS